jgi:hypothetical protein
MSQCSPRAASLLAALVLALGLAPPAIAAQQAEVYRVQHRTAEELLPYAEATLAGEGRVVIDSGTNSLVLFSERQDLLNSALALLATQDRALRTVVLEYASQRTSELAAGGVRIDWGVATGGVRIGNLIVPAGDSQVRVVAKAQKTRGNGSLGGTVRILEGHSGHISSGETRALTTRGRLGTTTTLVPADSGFEAFARVLGDGRVQLELRPFEAKFRADGRIETSEAATTLLLTPGKTVVIGGLSEDSGAASLDAFAGAERRSTRDERVLSITARVE